MSNNLCLFINLTSNTIHEVVYFLVQSQSVAALLYQPVDFHVCQFSLISPNILDFILCILLAVNMPTCELLNQEKPLKLCKTQSLTNSQSFGPPSAYVIVSFWGLLQPPQHT